MKKVLITGSTQGIGYAIAKKLVEENYYVIIHCSKDLEKAHRIQKEIGASEAVVCDLGNVNETLKLHDKTGDVDCLILNASMQTKNQWLNVSVEELEKQLDVNVKSTFLLMQKYFPGMKEKGFGRIITIGSTNQYRRHAELPIYSATKCAVFSLVQNIAKQSARYNVTVNNVSPGAISTPRNDDVLKDDDKKKAIESIIPAGRFGESEEIANVVSMLIKEENSYITGADIVIDGGLRL